MPHRPLQKAGRTLGPSHLHCNSPILPLICEHRRHLGIAGASWVHDPAALIQADARSLPLRDRSTDAIFAAGLITHLPEVHSGLREFARVAQPGGLLILFHPSGRAALAARHGHVVQPGDPLDRDVLAATLDAAGWQLTAYDDPEHRFLAIAVRCESAP
jgi:SAM-dependent methyltransferase